MKDRKQVYQTPEIEIQYLDKEDVVRTSDFTWNSNWNEDDWDNPDNTYIEN